MRSAGRHLLVNPVVGPEPVAGSSRMKGGTATLILLDVLCIKTLGKLEISPEDEGDVLSLSNLSTAELLTRYQQVHALTYSAMQQSLPLVMRSAAAAVANGGRLLYIGLESAGCLGFIDLSEMPDTYGAPFDQNRAFLLGGWKAAKNREGDISGASALHRIGFDHFLQDVVPTLTVRDALVVLLPPRSEVRNLLQLLHMCKPSTISVLCVRSRLCDPLLPEVVDLTGGRVVDVLQPHRDEKMLHEGFSDLAFKLMVNAISTYAQAAGRGALFRGLMIACGPANDKIYQRCITMISEHVGVTPLEAETALVRAIHSIDTHDQDYEAKLSGLLAMPRIHHIEAALLPPSKRHLPQIALPVAFLLAIPPSSARPSGWTTGDARQAVLQERQLSSLLSRALGERDATTVPASPQGVIGVDLGGTTVRAALVHVDGRLSGPVFRKLLGTDRSPEGVLAAAWTVVNSVLAAIEGGAGNKVAAVAVGQPGHLHPDGSISDLAAFSHWGATRVPVASFLKKKLVETSCGNSPPVFVFDDAHSALAGEVSFGAARLARTAVVLTIGTGVGSGVSLCNGAVLHDGARGLIELGHAIVGLRDSDPPSCACGQRGCLEAYASGPAVAKRAGCTTAHEVFEAIRSSTDAGLKSRCEAAVHVAAEALGVGVLMAIRAYDPDVVVLAGGLAPTFAPLIRAVVRQRAWSLHNDAVDVPISLPGCVEPGVQGAAALGWRHLQRPTGPPRGSGFYLRHAQLSDLDALYNVCLKTGDSGADGTHLFSDIRLLGSIYVGPYVTLAAPFTFALVDPSMEAFGGVCGYVLAALDTTAYNQACDSRWWPPLKATYPLDALSGWRPNEQQLIREQIYKDSSASGLSQEDLQRYPSHLHIDMLAHAQGHGLGVVMMTRLLDALRGAGSVGVHLTMSATNDRAYKFYLKLGFAVIVRGEDEWIMALSL